MSRRTPTAPYGMPFIRCCDVFAVSISVCRCWLQEKRRALDMAMKALEDNKAALLAATKGFTTTKPDQVRSDVRCCSLCPSALTTTNKRRSGIVVGGSKGRRRRHVSPVASN